MKRRKVVLTTKIGTKKRKYTKNYKTIRKICKTHTIP